MTNAFNRRTRSKLAVRSAAVVEDPAAARGQHETAQRSLAVPKGQSRIAQRFNAGLDTKRSRVPKGRLRSNLTPSPSAVPSGLVCHAGRFPALKRRAILRMSLRDKGTWYRNIPIRPL